MERVEGTTVSECVCVTASCAGFLLRWQMGCLPLLTRQHHIIYCQADAASLKGRKVGHSLQSLDNRWLVKPESSGQKTMMHSSEDIVFHFLCLFYVVFFLRLGNTSWNAQFRALNSTSNTVWQKASPCSSRGAGSCVSSRETSSSDSGRRLMLGCGEGGCATCWWAASPADSLRAAV